jgi:hypothetical protein
MRSLFITATLMCTVSASTTPVVDIPFIQEYHEAYPIRVGTPANEVRAITVDSRGTVWAATAAGLHALQNGAWSQIEGVTNGPMYEVYLDVDGSVWAGAWDGLYRIVDGTVSKIAYVQGTITAIARWDDGLIALGPEGVWRQDGNHWMPFENKWARHVRDAVVTADGVLYIATGVGLYNQRGKSMRHFYREEEIYSGDVRSVCAGPDGEIWIGALGGIDRYSDGVYRNHYGGAEGLPNADVRAIAFDRDGTLWAGTALGVARYDGKTWSLRHSRRWLLSDDVRGIAFGPDGTAWIATSAGVSAIKRRTMTLAQKADYFLNICHTRHIRPPYIVEKCWFPNPNDISILEPRDDDNDGSFTAMYLAMESYRWAVTKDPDARERARKAFEALEFLEQVTGVEGYFARTVVPSDWKEMADANHVMTPEEYAERRVRDPRTKRVDVRWHLSKDGKWYWKGDTSSDEMAGHMYGYFLYYELAADDAMRERVRTQVRKVMDYIIDGGYTIRDLDGKPTRWGVWAPGSVKNDPDWRVEGVNKTFEILSYLTASYHITGNEKYRREAARLRDEFGYGAIARKPKSYGRSERTHIQDELLALSTPGLLLSEKDHILRAQYLEGVTWAYHSVENDHNPYFNFTYGSVGGKDFHLDESVAFLRDQPLDLRQWTIDNSKREDITFARQPMLDSMQTSRMLPPSERGVMRWDKNPWDVVSGDFTDPEGHRESSGVFWLLPYWIGRYYGYIAAPD